MRRRWFWIALFITLAAVLGTLAAGWNVVLVRDHLRMAEMAERLAGLAEASRLGFAQAPSVPWLPLILGSVGFLVVIAAMGAFFVRLLREMRLNQLQSEFLATVSHELKTPIAALELCADLLAAPGAGAPAERDALWDTHRRELKRLRSDVEALLEAARWQALRPAAAAAGRVGDAAPPDPAPRADDAPVDLEAWVSHAVARGAQIFPTLRIRRSGASLAGVPLPGDLRTLDLIVDNLFDNARKFSPLPHAPVHVEVSREPGSWRGLRAPRWRVCVRDEGRGFAPAEARKLFRRFFRARGHAADAPIPGTGLGLYIAASAARSLGLGLLAESAGPGRGAVFILEGKAPRP